MACIFVAKMLFEHVRGELAFSFVELAADDRVASDLAKKDHVREMHSERKVDPQISICSEEFKDVEGFP